MPPKFFICLPVVEPVETFEEDLSARDLPIAKGGVDIPLGSPARSYKEPNVVAEG